MRRNSGFLIVDFGLGKVVLLALGVLLLLSGGVAAQGGYELSWWTVDGGGYTFSSGGGYSLGGTIGQADAGLLTGPGYELAGGFWNGGGGRYRVYVPVVLRSYWPRIASPYRLAVFAYGRPLIWGPPLRLAAWLRMMKLEELIA